MDDTLHVHLLGSVYLERDGREINDNCNRSRKVWLLLSYLIYYRSRPIPNRELSDLLWERDTRANPVNALKTMLHRLRSVLDQLGEHTGHDYIIRTDGNYAWNTSLPMELDLDRFSRLCHQGDAAQEPAEKLSAWLEALDLYQGDFLSKLSAEPWVTPISVYYHNLYVNTAVSALELLFQEGQNPQIASLCRKAVQIEPDSEELYRYYLRALLALGEHRQTIEIYDEMSQRFFANFGVTPSEDLRAIYREALNIINDHTVAPTFIVEQLREPPGAQGALYCDYDFFQVTYHAVSRAIERNGDAVHLGLISLSGKNGDNLSPKILERAMNNLRQVALSNLRRGDVVSQCSISQFVLMLLQSNYEDSNRVCERVCKAFIRQYPHTSVSLHCCVLPLEPKQ